ncbi:MAG: GNAT family N-acetyltransferase [Saprospiraceae bacterium]|nr:GNAT family N-acetyltransferase [Saprospiraceae bacterium]
MDTQALNGPILPVTHSDIPLIRSLQPLDWPDIGQTYSFYINNSFCHPVKLEQHNNLIAIGCLICFEKSAWLGQIIVHEAFRNHGWGSYITRSLVEMAPSQIQCVSLLATPMGEPVYKKLGFKAQGEYVFYIKEDQIPEIRSSRIIKWDNRFLDQLLDLDLNVSGENRSALIQQFLDDAWVYVDHDKLLAFYLPGLGEGLISSREVEAGLELLHFKLNKHKRNVVPVQNTRAVEFLEHHGFGAYRQATRMVIGMPFDFQAEKIYSRIGGNLG